jgi:hypothetical protein
MMHYGAMMKKVWAIRALVWVGALAGLVVGWFVSEKPVFYGLFLMGAIFGVAWGVVQALAELKRGKWPDLWVLSMMIYLIPGFFFVGSSGPMSSILVYSCAVFFVGLSVLLAAGRIVRARLTEA